jgi:hypothetical protein
MQDEKGERWRELCEQAALEEDPARLMQLITKSRKCWTKKNSDY